MPPATWQRCHAESFGAVFCRESVPAIRPNITSSEPTIRTLDGLWRLPSAAYRPLLKAVLHLVRGGKSDRRVGPERITPLKHGALAMGVQRLPLRASGPPPARHGSLPVRVPGAPRLRVNAASS